ncbi:Elongator complex protein 4 [Diplogelasinospora grovesii]|uniref:Elongator complex protein 4 n=1 Tax=Diplogelasinospora grovesii TaxID=303347 RepID=A0AAN6NFF6_9PEZI|nr:Elongator complex protein 4 [Diplogelasinospora grovesii]
MSFKKRNVVLSSPRAGPGLAAVESSPARPQQQQQQQQQQPQLAPGLRPSPLDGRLTTSTGTSSLDQLLAGHGGLPLGTCLLVEEQGTTDFSGVLLRYYAAEGLVQGHQVHTLCFPPEWRYQLPALATEDPKKKAAQPAPPPEDKMKIAWRYEALGNASGPTRGESSNGATFCHSFDLTKRLASASCKGALHPTPPIMPALLDQRQPTSSPLKATIKHLRTKMESMGPSVVHRVIVPSLLSPSLYPPGCCRPSEILQFLHALRALLREYSSQLTALITLPTSLFPRGSGLVRWMELLCDGVIELVPLPANPGAPPPQDKKEKSEDKVQGMLKVYTLPVYHEKGGGGGAATSHFRENLSFSLSASKGLVIKPYSLPPMLEEDNKEKSPASTVKDSMEF